MAGGQKEIDQAKETHQESLQIIDEFLNLVGDRFFHFTFKALDLTMENKTESVFGFSWKAVL